MQVELSQHPEILAVIRAADPSYRKRRAWIRAAESLELSGTYWDGGSRSSYSAVNLATRRAGPAPQYDPPQFGGPSVTPRVSIPEGVAIVKTGTFCGRTAQAYVYLNPANMAKLIEVCHA